MKDTNQLFCDKKHFDPTLIIKLPGNLKYASSIENLYGRDIFILSVLLGMSSCMPNVYSNYRGKRISPHHYLYVVGEPESEKSMILFAKSITKLVNKKIYGAYLEKKKAYDNYDKKSGEKRPPFPKLRKLYISDDITSAAFMKQIVNQTTTGSLLVSSEASNLFNSLGKRDHGGFLGNLLKSYEHEPIDKDLSEDVEYVYSDFPMLSMALASNVKDFKKILGEANSSGLLSRLLLYTTQSTDTEIRIDDSFEYEEVTKKLQDDCLRMYEFLLNGSFEFRLDNEQKEHWHYIVNKLKADIKVLNPSINFGMRRFSKSLYRGLMITSTYRKFCSGTLTDIIRPEEDDFAIIKDLAYLQAKHASTIYDLLEEGDQIKKPLSVYEVLDSMPDCFHSKEFAKKLQEIIGISERTAERRIADLKRQGKIITNKKGKLLKRTL